ncbi:MAG TPA: hypothetical protein ENK59_08965 [Thioploca sp.]|nr:hypothetical protein [Thioploca sp.]
MKFFKKIFSFGTLMFMIGIMFVGIFNISLEATNTIEFCTSCHSMQNNLAELKQNVHYNNASGVTVGCPDCHVPRDLIPKLQLKLIAVKDIYHEIIGTIDTKEKFEARRWQLANQVWDRMIATDSRECRECHSFEHMDLQEQDDSAQTMHKRAIKKGKTCIECHKGIAHEEPDEPD